MSLDRIFLGTLFMLVLTSSAALLAGDALAVGTYSCKWVNTPDGNYNYNFKVSGKCVIDTNKCNIQPGWVPGNACDAVDKITYFDKASEQSYKDAKELEKQCESISAAACVIAHPTFRCQWVVSGAGTTAKGKCELDPSNKCDAGFSYSVSCSNLSEENCKSDKNIKKNCVASGGQQVDTSVPPDRRDGAQQSQESKLDAKGITLFADSGYRGDSRVISDNIADLKTQGFNDKTSSIQVSGGTWELCTDKDYKGKCVKVSSNISNVGSELGINDKISSVRKEGSSKESTLDDGKSKESVLGGEFQIKNPLKAGTIPEILDRIAGFLYYLALAVVTIMVLWAGFQILTAAGSPEGIDKGKRTLLWAVIGTVVILIAGGIADIVADILGGGGGTGPAIQEPGQNPIPGEGPRAK